MISFPTSNFDGVVEVGRLEGGDLAGVVAGVALLRLPDLKGVPVGPLVQLEAGILLNLSLIHI